MVGSFSLDYFTFVFIAAVGVLQMVASHQNLRGLLFFRMPILAFLVGLGLTIAAFLWFFLSESRNISDTDGGLDGNGSAGLFALGSLAALFTTFIISSLVNRSFGKGSDLSGHGLDALRKTSYLRAFCRSLRDLWKRS